MATRSTIWIKNKSGNYDGIYCHWDGYPSCNGKILLEHYSDEEKLKELISHGSCSILAPEIHPSSELPHGFEIGSDKRQNNVCLFYHRDRDDDLEIEKNVFEISLEDYYQEYNYIFKDGVWYCNGSLLSEILKSEGVI